MLKASGGRGSEGELYRRTKACVLQVIAFASELPPSPLGHVIRGQVLRSGASMGANYRAALRARSKAEFVAKMGTVEEETDETMYWVELSVDAGLLAEDQVAVLHRELDDILAMVVASIRTARAANNDRGGRD